MKRIIKLIMVCLVVMLGTDAYAVPYLMVYDGGGTGGIQAAMTDLGFTVGTDYILKGSGDTISDAELASVDALIVGWNELGSMSGLSATVLENGITGNILLTGHDADYHTAFSSGAVEAAATLFLDQAISFAQEQSGTGLVALGDFSTGFTYLPSSWGITAISGMAGTGDASISITPAGVASGVYDGLTGADMSPWSNSYHNEFTAWDPRFEVFENHHTIAVPITLGYIVPVPAALLLGVLGLSVAGVKLRKFA